MLPSPREPVFHFRFSTPERLPGENWGATFLRRVRHGLLLKTLGISGFMWLFFIAYFELLRYPAQAVTTMPLTALDAAVPFTPGSLWLYLSLWFYVGTPAGLSTNLRQLIVYGLWASALCIAGLAVFYFWPTAVPAGLAPADAARHAGFALLQGVDAAGNACPSMHVASAVFTAFWVHRIWRRMGAPLPWLALNIVWAALIVWSTMATKQHVALDVLGGVLLALVFVPLSMRWYPYGPAAEAAAAGGAVPARAAR